MQTSLPMKGLLLNFHRKLSNKMKGVAWRMRRFYSGENWQHTCFNEQLFFYFS